MPAERQELNGPYYSTTYDASGPLALMRDLLHKFFVTGFHGTVRNYMTPERLYEEPIFATLQAHGLTCEGLNDRSRGTYEYDLNSAYAIEKVHELGGTVVACSDSSGYVVDENGIDLALVKEIKEVKRGRATCHRCKKTAQSRPLTAAPRVKQGCKDDAEERFPS